jgi:tripartite-type tricarboxylate transporter receptor subunit TctC
MKSFHAAAAGRPDRFLSLAILLLAPLATAQEWPPADKGPVKIIAPFAPGSTPDTLARLLADALGKNTKKAFIVENKAGAAGMIGTDAVAKAAPDGTTIGVSIGGPLVNNTLLYKTMPYDPFRDLAPITLAVNQPCVLVASNASGIGSVSELVAELQKNPSKYNYGSFGNGTMSHMVMVMIANQTNSQLVQVPYPGAAQVVQALVAGDVNLACIPAAPAVPQAKAGKLKVLGHRRQQALQPDAGRADDLRAGHQGDRGQLVDGGRGAGEDAARDPRADAGPRSRRRCTIRGDEDAVQPVHGAGSATRRPSSLRT